MAKQKEASTSWAISTALSLSFSGKKEFTPNGGGSHLGMTLFDVKSQIFFPIGLTGGTIGGGLPINITVTTFSPTFFTTSEPMWVKDFKWKRASILSAELAIGVGGSLAVMTFWGIDHNPYWLNIGGLEVGVAGGIGAGLWQVVAVDENGQENRGCLISPGGDPLCGGSSKKEGSQSTSSVMSGGR